MNNCVVMSGVAVSIHVRVLDAAVGSGTSGRMAFFVARTMNAAVSTLLGVKTQASVPRVTAWCFEADGQFFRYLISGGDAALLFSDELPGRCATARTRARQTDSGAEDDPPEGKRDLQSISAGKKRVRNTGPCTLNLIEMPSNAQVLFIGITCGLSAPYVAGQLDHAMNAPPGTQFYAVMMGQYESIARTAIHWSRSGFNPVELARNTQIEKWGTALALCAAAGFTPGALTEKRTFLGTAKEVRARYDAFLANGSVCRRARAAVLCS